MKRITMLAFAMVASWQAVASEIDSAEPKPGVGLQEQSQSRRVNMTAKSAMSLGRGESCAEFEPLSSAQVPRPYGEE